jgi:DNA-binding winged helix-turn-helix (wHTH) protein/TolB-like protein/Tfp pilus assembly protein PilF
MPRTFTDLQRGFELGPWTVMPERGLLRQGAVEEHLEPMVMDVLVALASRQGGVVTRDQLVDAVWNGRATADDAIAAKIATLRNKLGDDSRHPEYIETVQKRGYRLKMPVEVSAAPEPEQRGASYVRVSRPVLLAALAALAIAVIIWWLPTNKPVDSVAVLQFKNLSDDKEKFQYVVDGFREELVISLNQVPNLNFTRGPELSDDRTAKMIAKDLGVGVIVTGSLRTDGDKIRITVELISADRFQIWSGKFDGAADDVFSLQERVATEVRDELLGEKGEQIRAASRPANPAAFDRYMLGRFFLGKRDIESLRHARALFQETIEIDPNFGPAYLRLAINYLLLADYSPKQRRQIFAQAIEVANQGVQADPSIRAPAAIIYGSVDHQLGNWAAAEDAFATAFRSVTVYPTAYHWHARLLGDLGLLDRSLQQAMTALSMEPASQILNSRVAIAYFWTNDIPKARHYFEVANNMGVGAAEHHFAYTLFLLRDNRLEDARATMKFGLKLAQSDDWWVDPVIDALVHPGNQEMLGIAFETIEKMIADGVSPFITMTVWALLGQADRVMEIAMQVAESEPGTLYELEIIYLDEFKALREHENFPALLQALGLTNYWNSIGCRWSNDQVHCDTA